MSTYRNEDGYLAPSLVALFNEVDARWPARSKASDGWIGDAAHLARSSDHNPDKAAGGVVRAIDVTAQGINVPELLAAIIRDPRVWYVIWNRQIASVTYGWKWQNYTGTNPHTKHIHISIKHNRAAETSTARWFKLPTATKDTDMTDAAALRNAVKLGTLDALREYGAALFKDSGGTADRIWDESRENQRAILEAINEVTAAIRERES